MPNKISANTYRTKKLVSPFMMGVESIHACSNHCILYRGDTFKDLDKWHVCSASWYKNNTGYYDGDNQVPADGNKQKKGAGNSVASIEPVREINGLLSYYSQSLEKFSYWTHWPKSKYKEFTEVIKL